MENKIFIFDMDGVIVNTLDALYSLYLDFLKEVGIKGNKKEFNLLNGPKIEQIILYLKQKYKLKLGKEELLKRYKEKIDKIYPTTELISEVNDTLELLKKNNLKIALVSSAKRKNIELVLKRFNLMKYFDFVVSGDDVNEAKPSPTIYNLVKNRFKNHEYYVIEDSQYGIDSAISANMKVIFFNPNQKKIMNKTDYIISEIGEIERILREIYYKTIIVSKDIQVKIKEHSLKITLEQEEITNKIWAKEKKKNPSLFNGKMISYYTHHFEGDILIIECFLTEYKYFLAQFKNKYINLGITPLAVSGIIIDRANQTLVGRRGKKVTEYPNFYEFVPSGGISNASIRDSDVLFIGQVRQELNEEADIHSKSIRKIMPLGLVLDKKHNVYDICVVIYLKDLVKLNINKEYKSQKIVKLNGVSNLIKKSMVVPTSKMIYSLFTQKDN